MLRTTAIALVSLLLLASCDGGGSSSPTPTTTTTARTPAQVTVVVGDVDVGIQSFFPPLLSVDFLLTLRESAGTAVNVNFIRFEVRWVDGASERRELGSSDIIVALGSNVLPANGSLSSNIHFAVTSRSKDIDGLILTIGMTDVYGNDKTVVRDSRNGPIVGLKWVRK